MQKSAIVAAALGFLVIAVSAQRPSVDEVQVGSRPYQLAPFVFSARRKP